MYTVSGSFVGANVPSCTHVNVAVGHMLCFLLLQVSVPLCRAAVFCVFACTCCGGVPVLLAGIGLSAAHGRATSTAVLRVLQHISAVQDALWCVCRGCAAQRIRAAGTEQRIQ